MRLIHKLSSPINIKYENISFWFNVISLIDIFSEYLSECYKYKKTKKYEIFYIDAKMHIYKDFHKRSHLFIFSLRISFHHSRKALLLYKKKRRKEKLPLTLHLKT